MTRCSISVVFAVVILAVFAEALFPHGGNYRGPAGSPGNPVTSAGGASSPAPPTAPSGPGTTPPGAVGVTRRPNASRTISFEDWEFWWGHNKEVYLNLKETLHRPTLPTESADFFFGRRTGSVVRDTERPGAEALRSRLIPLFVDSLASEHFDLRDSACIALGKIGRAGEVEPLVRCLEDKVASVREGAVIGLGLLRAREAIPALLALLEDDPAAVRLRGRHPETRLRALAAVSLGLIGDNTRDEVRIALMRSSRDPEVIRDIAVNCAIGLGLLVGDNAYADCIVRHLRELIASPRRIDDWVRAHATTALGRFHARNGLRPTDETVTFVTRLMRRDPSSHVRRSAAISLGILIREPDAQPDAVKTLRTAWLRARDLQTRNFASIALGQMGGEEAFEQLRADVIKSRNQRLAWAALGLGILCEKILGDPAWQERRTRALEALRDAFRKTDTPHIRGAIAIALGIARDAEAGPALLEALKTSRDPTFRGYLALALGMARHIDATDDLTALLKASTNQPLLRQQVVIGLGLLGSRRTIPALLRTLRETRSSYVLSSTTMALGFIGDRLAVQPLVAVVKDNSLPPLIRGFGIMALGCIADPERIPLISSIAAGHNYLASTDSLNQLLYIL
jgi:HEAT repeat protein